MGRVFRYRTRFNSDDGVAASIFPLALSSSRRYLQTAQGVPFFGTAEGVWSLPTQLNSAQVITYLDNRAAKGFTAIQFMAIAHLFTSQSPKWKSAAGYLPFSYMAVGSVDLSTTLVESYWAHVDFVVAQAKARGMACFIAPAYAGYNGEVGATAQGWKGEVDSNTAAKLLTYGNALGTRYNSYGNVIWLMGGDYSDATFNAHQWNIFDGVRQVNSNALVMAHAGRGVSGYTGWSSQVGSSNFINTIYTDGTEYTYAMSEYARANVMAFGLTEGYYEGYGIWTPEMVRRQAYATMLQGGAFQVFGNVPVFGFGEPDFCSNLGPATILSSYLESDGAVHMSYFADLVAAYDWHLLVPKNDTSLVTTSLGTGDSRIMPALASDGSFAFVWTPGTGNDFTVDMSKITAPLTPSTVRARWYNTTTGAYTTIGNYSNSGTQAFTAPTYNAVLVLD